jgi:hypothetical protein
MQINLQITYLDDTTKEVTAIAVDLVAFEQKFDLSITKLEKELKLTHLLFIAWNVESRTKATALDFEAWVATVAGIGIAATPK